MSNPYRSASPVSTVLKFIDDDERQLWEKWVESFLVARLNTNRDDSNDSMMLAGACVERADFLIQERRKRL